MSLSTDPYKGTRDFYPEDMAVEQYIFDTWAKTAESFGYERYDASIPEPSELYKSKCAENEELVNEQTYTFTDRGEREVTLRPEMTPTVARMIAGKRRELSFPVRWYSIPNLFRYERPQRGRLREHWQLNCDMFGENDISADIEMIALAHNVLSAFGATSDDFEIRINHRQLMTDFFSQRYGITDSDIINQVNRILDQKRKVADAIFNGLLEKFVHEKFEQLREDLVLDIDSFVQLLNTEKQHSTLVRIKNALNQIGIKVVFDATLARGFDYYTGTIFEIFDKSGENNRSLLGGGRYDNLTGLFGGDPIPGIGFGMGDVTMRDFLETHDLIPDSVKTTAPTLIVVPTDVSENVPALALAQTFRSFGITTCVDTSDKKLGKKIGIASDRGATYVVVVGSNELQTNHFTLKNLKTEEERSGTPEELASQA
jgi:histidyl-tRNA synthetase